MELTLRKVKLALLQSTIALVTLLLVMLSLFPERLTLPAEWMPEWMLISIFFCGLFRRSALPPWLIFLTGLVQDALTGLPLGVTPLVYLTFLTATSFGRKRLIHRAFPAIWAGFCLMSFGAMLLRWLALSMYHASMLPVGTGLSQWGMSICLYPLMHAIFSRSLMLALSLHTKERISRNYAR